MARPEFKLQFTDGYWLNLSELIGTRHYFNDIYVEHKHFIIGKRFKDDLQSDYEKLKELL